VQVDIRGENIGRRTPVDVALVGSVRDTVRALLPLLSDARDDAHLTRMLAHYRRTRGRLDALAFEGRDRGPLHPQFVTSAVDRLGADDAVFLPDVGTPTLWAARYLRMNGRRRLIGSFSHGTMANALPQGIGVQAAHPGRQVVALSGDGGLAMLLGELLTLRQQKLPVKVVVLNNGALSFVELEMKADGIVNYGTDLDNPDFAEIARAVGLFGMRVEHPRELDDALRAAFAHPGPALVDVVTAAGVGPAAEDLVRGGAGLQPVGDAERPQRRRQRGARGGEDQPPPARARVTCPLTCRGRARCRAGRSRSRSGRRAVAPADPASR